jgi:hypothetical protein
MSTALMDSQPRAAVLQSNVCEKGSLTRKERGFRDFRQTYTGTGTD